MYTLGKRIKAVRQATGQNQMSFAQSVGVTQSTVSRWELDTDDPNDDNLDAILDQARKHKEAGLPWRNIMELRYGVTASGDSEGGVVPLFDFRSVAALGKRISSAEDSDRISKARGSLNLSIGGRNLVAVMIDDESMARFAAPGSQAVIDLGDTDLDDGSLGLFLHRTPSGERKAVLRILRTAGALRLEPTNPSAEADTIFLDEDPTILGRAISVVTDLPRRAV